MAEQKHKITIIGLGLIGGSLGMALKAANLGDSIEIVGHDRDSGAENIARKRGAIDRAEHNLPRAVEGAAIIIVATPITEVAEVFKQIAPHLTPGTVVTDTASTKTQVMRWAQTDLPDDVMFIGGHPMAGKETSGIEASDPTLFQGRAYCVCPSLSASPAAIKQITTLAELVGAVPLFMDAEEHDQYAAAISHLPLVVSTALFSLVRSSPSWDDLGAMASSGFSDVTRLASGDPNMTMGIWMTNREAMIHWLERMIAELDRYRQMLNDAQDDALLRLFTQASFERDQFIAEPPARRPTNDGPKVDRQRMFMDMIIGGKLAENLERMKQLPKIIDQQSKGDGSAAQEKRRKSLAEKIEEGVRRDLEKLAQREASETDKKPDK